MPQTNQAQQSFTPSEYGNLSRVAAQFHITNGNPAELNAAYWYARYAARAAVDGACLCGCGSAQHHQEF